MDIQMDGQCKNSIDVTPPSVLVWGGGVGEMGG